MSRVASCWGDGRVTLMIDKGHIELGAAQIGQAGGGG